MTQVPDMAKRILIICNDYTGNTMAGPGIRAWEMAHALARKGHETVLLSRHIERGFTDGSISFIGRASFYNLIKWIRRSHYVIQAGRPLSILVSVLFRRKILFDQYDPVIFEYLEKKGGSYLREAQREG